MSPDKSFIKYAITLLQVLRDKGGQLRLAETIEAAAERLGLASWQLDQPGFGGEPSIRTDLTWARAHLISWGYLTLVAPGQVRLSAQGAAASNTGSIASAEELFSDSQRRFISGLQQAAASATTGRPPAPPTPVVTPAATGPIAEIPPSAPEPVVTPVPAMETTAVAPPVPVIPPEPVTARPQEVVSEAASAAASNREGLPTSRDLGTIKGDDLIPILDSLNEAIFGKLLENLLSRQGFTDVSITERLEDGSISGIGTLAINPLLGLKGMLHIKKTQIPISRALIREFRGTLVGRASKGIFVTTGRFTPEARAEAEREGVDPIDLFDGLQLVRMLEELELVVKARTVYDLDPLFFEV
ncbi:MAG: restriction endonuclease [Cyanobacteriota bacterium]